MTTRSPTLRRFLDNNRDLFLVTAPEELVPVENFAGSDLANHRFAFYGETFDLPQNIDWNHNPGAQHWGHDLNRFGFLVLHTPADEPQAHAMERLILDWIRKNDQFRYKSTPYAWQNLLNIAIRIENWGRFLASRREEGASTLTSDEWRLIKQSIFRQLIILLRQIARRGYESNWAPIGLRSALYILYSMPLLPQRERLIRLAWRGLKLSAERQVLPDGAQQELSPHYHWVALELFSSCRAMARQAGRQEEGQALDETIIAMMRFLEALILPDGGIVAFGDSDFDYGPRIKAFLDRLREEFSFTETPPISVFPYAGIAVARHLEDKHILAFDAGPFGTAHQHEDALSFWLTAFGEHFLIDPGRYLYDYTPESMYTFLRSSAAHSTILIAGKGQAAKIRKADWRRAKPGWPVMEEGKDHITLRGCYEAGYGDAAPDVIHERVIEIDRNKARWVIRDRLHGKGRVPVESRFQFAPCNWSLDDRSFVARRGGVQLALQFDSPWHSSVAEGALSPKGGWYSPGLNRIEPAPCLLLAAEMELPSEVVTEITATALDEAVLSSGINRLG